MNNPMHGTDDTVVRHYTPTPVDAMIAAERSLPRKVLLQWALAKLREPHPPEACYVCGSALDGAGYCDVCEDYSIPF